MPGPLPKIDPGASYVVGGGLRMNLKLKEVFRGKVVNKAHTINTGVDEFPRYVLELSLIHIYEPTRPY